MTIILLFLLGIAYFVGTLILHARVGFEWWVLLINLLIALALIAGGIYKLCEELSYLRRAKKPEKKPGRVKTYPIKQLDLVEMMLSSYHDRKKYSSAIMGSSAIDKLARAYRAYCKSGKEEHLVLSAFETLMAIFFLNNDQKNDIDSNEYALYLSFCKKVSATPKPKAALKQNAAEPLDPKNIELLRHIVWWRNRVKPDVYRSIVHALCDLALRDETVYEDEYYVIRVLFSDQDKWPRDWQTFKQEYH